MQIPQSFMVGRATYTVRFSRSLSGERRGAVRLYPPPNVIRIATHRLDKECSNRELAHTFWHEAVHAILFNMGEHELCFNEQFVDGFAKRINQIVHTAKL